MSRWRHERLYLSMLALSTDDLLKPEYAEANFSPLAIRKRTMTLECRSLPRVVTSLTICFSLAAWAHLGLPFSKHTSELPLFWQHFGVMQSSLHVTGTTTLTLQGAMRSQRSLGAYQITLSVGILSVWIISCGYSMSKIPLTFTSDFLPYYSPL